MSRIQGKSRKARLAEMRDQVAAQKHHEQAVEIIQQLEAWGKTGGGSPAQVGALKAALDGRMKLVAKYLPDTRHVEMDANVSTNHESQLDELE